MLTLNRIGLLLASLSLLSVFLFPLWKIELSAPQYPDGLEMQIWVNKITGDVDIINGLNHYIGMRIIKEADFPEFVYLPYIISGFTLLGLLTSLANKRFLLITWSVLYILFGIAAMTDFYFWEYNYGHNLDPHAPIQVPGASYQPPLIGYKQMLNFGAYSIPHIAGWVFIGCGLLASLFLFTEWRVSRKIKSFSPALAALFCGMLFFSSCTVETQPIRYGRDDCDFCKMTIVDKRYGAEILTKKGKAFKFDDANCLVKYIATGEIDKSTIQGSYIINFSKADEFMNVENSSFLHSPKLRSPMAGNIAAFENEAEAEAAKKELEGTIIKWQQLADMFK